MPIHLRKRSIVSIIAVLLLLVGVMAAAAFLVGRFGEDQAKVNESLETELKLARLLSIVQDAETGQRGYLLTERRDYLGPHEAAARLVDANLQSLRAIYARNPRMTRLVDELEVVVEAKFAELRRTIDLTLAGRKAAALAVVQTDEGLELMSRARALIQSFQDSVQVELNERQAYTLRTAELARWGVAVALLLALGLGALVLRDGQRLIAETVAANEALTLANHKIHEEMAQNARLEAQLRQSQKLEAIGQLTGGVAHDFNNMLAVIIGSLNLLKRRVERGETDFLRFVESALEGAERAAVLTHRLLAFARRQPLAPQSVDCNRLVSGMSDLLRRSLGEAVRVETVLAGGLWRTHVDPSQLENAVLNLAVNGRDAMPEGGRLTVETANASLDEAYAARHVGVEAGQYVLVSVTDEGAGMTPEVAAKAFDPFFTTKETGKGTGLGLSQVFGFVKQSGGHVKIYTEEGQGTSMKIYLPRFFGVGDDRRRGAVETASGGVPLGSPDIVVLVVEDEERMLRLSTEAFRDLGYTALEANGPAAALRLLEERADVALMFTDVVMPGMNGRRLAQEAQAKRPDLKVIYTTGFSRNAVIHNGVLDPDVDFLPKPFSLEQLARKARAALSRPV